MATKFVCVLHKSPKGHYGVDYVEKLFEGFKKHSGLPEENFVCLSNDENVPNRIPLKYSHLWDSWWSKMELFRPDIFQDDDILYVDLDTLIVGDISRIIEICELMDSPMMLRDFYFRNRLASGVMWIPKKFKSMVWNNWISDSKNIMARCGTYGDQMFIGDLYQHFAKTFQEIVGEDQIISYKGHVKKGLSNGNEKIICYHGRPRPRDTGWSKE